MFFMSRLSPSRWWCWKRDHDTFPILKDETICMLLRFFVLFEMSWAALRVDVFACFSNMLRHTLCVLCRQRRYWEYNHKNFRESESDDFVRGFISWIRWVPLFWGESVCPLCWFGIKYGGRQEGCKLALEASGNNQTAVGWRRGILVPYICIPDVPMYETCPSCAVEDMLFQFFFLRFFQQIFQQRVSFTRVVRSNLLDVVMLLKSTKKHMCTSSLSATHPHLSQPIQMESPGASWHDKIIGQIVVKKSPNILSCFFHSLSSIDDLFQTPQLILGADLSIHDCSLFCWCDVLHCSAIYYAVSSFLSVEGSGGHHNSTTPGR